MARAVWTGTISFGLVSVPVRLYPATRRQDVRFHEIDRLSGQRIRHQKVIEAPWSTPSDLAAPTLSTPGGEGFMPGRKGVVPTPTLPPREMEPRPGGAAQPVAAADVVKGFEVAKDRYVTVGREELEELAPERTRTIDVEQFVDATGVDP